MKLSELLSAIALGEDSRRQFKADVRNAESLASEMAALANSDGGTIFIGVADDGTPVGLDDKDVFRVNQLIGNAASQLVRSPLAATTENVGLKNGRLVIVLTVPKGLDKPYFDKNGVIWLKAGADKRRVNSKEELRRLFQVSGQFHADELPTKAGPEKLDKLRFRDFLRDVHGWEFPEAPADLSRLLGNMNLAGEDGFLNLAGVLMFAERPEWIAPQFGLKAIRYSGGRIHADEYLDAEDFAGPLPKIFEGAHAFIMRNLHKTQAGRGVNAPGRPEAPAAVFEELLVNALVHRDYLISAPIRLFIFDDRIEIISPGTLPNNLTVEKIRAGNSNIRNPILVSYAAKGLLPYRGLGSGIKRALHEWPDINFIDDVEAGLFTCIIHRRPAGEFGKNSPAKLAGGSVETSSSSVEIDNGSVENRSGSVETGSGSVEIEARLLAYLAAHPEASLAEAAGFLGLSPRAVEKRVAKLKTRGLLERIGPKKGGRWKVLKRP